MPKKKTIQRAREDAREGKAPSTQAGEFVREEIEHIRQGKHGARSAKQAIAIGLSKARKAGVPLPPRGQKVSQGQTRRHKIAPSARRSQATLGALRSEPRAAASSRALSRQARRATRTRKAK